MLDLKPELIAQLDTQARQAIELWGPESQFNMVIEETSELLNEVAKIHRDRQDWEHILEESVDTYIMMTEVFIIYGPERVNAMLEKKLNKFKGNLERSKAKKDTSSHKTMDEDNRQANQESNVVSLILPDRPTADNVVVLFPSNGYSGA